MPKVMVVDDDPAGQRLIKYMLTPEGYEVITASNGILGLQMATQESPDLVILDVMLPGLDGFEVCRRLRTGAKTSTTPIIMLSGKSQASDRDTGLKMGANEYLVKPVERQSLIEIIGRLLSESSEETAEAKIIAFIGSRGGVGTSTVTTSVSVALEKAGKSTILVDLTPSYSTLDSMMGLKTEESVAGILKDASGTIDVEKLKGLFEQHSSGVKLLWGEAYPEESESYGKENVRTLFSELCNLSEYVIADVPASPSENAVTALSLADKVILVSGSGKESLDRIETSISRLVRFGVKREKLHLVLVDKTGNDSDVSTMNDIGGIKVIGRIHSGEDECTQAETKGNPVVVCIPSSTIAEDMNKLAASLIELD